MGKITADNWKMSKKIERKYYTMIQKLLEPVKKEMKNAKTIEDMKTIVKKAQNSKMFNKKADDIVETISTMIYEDGAKTWRKAASKSSRGKEISTLLRKEKSNAKFAKIYNEILSYNATLIKTLPLDVSNNVINHIETKSYSGKRAKDLSKEIKKFFPKNTKAKAELISRTETSKISSALTQARSEMLDLNWYVWRTSMDARVRDAHAHMEDVIINFKNPPVPEKLNPRFKGKKYPAPYNAGNIYNCRCYAETLIDYDDVKWPHKVYNYKTGKIEMMTLSKFKELGGK